MTTVKPITLDAASLARIGHYLGHEAATQEQASELSMLAHDFLALARAASKHDEAHPGDRTVWMLCPPDAEPSPLLRIETVRGPASVDVRAIVGEVTLSTRVGYPTDVSVAWDGAQRLHFFGPADAYAALDRIHAARVAHDDAHRHALVAEAVGKAVASELRVADLPGLIREAIERLIAERTAGN